LRVTSLPLLTFLGVLEIGLCYAALCAITWKKQWAEYTALGALLTVHALSCSVLEFILHIAVHHFKIHPLYCIYFYVYWISFAIESILALLVVYGIFRLAMAPLQGLQKLGMLVFRWAASISVVVALGSALAPETTGSKYFIAAVSQLQRTQSILTLCLLVFVCFAVRPMGIHYGSRIFGVSLGLGIMATNDLVHSAWIVLNPRIYSTYNIINGVVICLILGIWTTYFALPEPKRRIIVLPTTSPFLRWNQISQVLGDSPGFVAVGGVPTELFAPAELEVMSRASRKMPIPIHEVVAPSFEVTSKFPESLSA
jgi:hypothetical protein